MTQQISSLISYSLERSNYGNELSSFIDKQTTCILTELSDALCFNSKFNVTRYAKQGIA